MVKDLCINQVTWLRKHSKLIQLVQYNNVKSTDYLFIQDKHVKESALISKGTNSSTAIHHSTSLFIKRWCLSPKLLPAHIAPKRRARAFQCLLYNHFWCTQIKVTVMAAYNVATIHDNVSELVHLLSWWRKPMCLASQAYWSLHFPASADIPWLSASAGMSLHPAKHPHQSCKQSISIMQTIHINHANTRHQSGKHSTPIRQTLHTNQANNLHQSGKHPTPIRQNNLYKNQANTPHQSGEPPHQSGKQSTPIRQNNLYKNQANTPHQSGEPPHQSGKQSTPIRQTVSTNQ